jgi:murein L,D-transpeptidase YafK
LLSLVALVSSGRVIAQEGVDPMNEPETYRSVAAMARNYNLVRSRWRAAGALWPPKDIYIRVFKLEGEVELWARAQEGKREVLVHRFPVCASSGTLGPKVRQGDRQVPEGFYWVNHINPDSDFHLSLGIDYPNAVDRARSGVEPTGGEIYLHGDCVTIGCVPLQDEPVEFLYTAIVSARNAGQKRFPVHSFPCRMLSATCARALANQPNLAQHRRLWSTLRSAFRLFEARRVVPEICLSDEPFYIDCQFGKDTR